MHSKIIRISKYPLPKPEYVDVSVYTSNGFVGKVADYVGVIDQAAREKFLVELDESDAFRVEGDCLIIADPDAYFESKYEEFCDRLNFLGFASYSDFCHNLRLETDIARLSSAYDDKNGLYVHMELDGMQTFDHWMRSVERGDRFYIGDILDYHF